MALSEKIEVSGLEFTFKDGKVNPDAHVAVVRRVLDGSTEIARQKHRYAVNVATGDCAHMTGPEVSTADKAAIAAQCEAMRGQYQVWSPE